MKFQLKTQGAQFTLEREFSLGRGPALEFKINEYELSGNLEELIKGLQSLAKLIEPALDELKTETNEDDVDKLWTEGYPKAEAK